MIWCPKLPFRASRACVGDFRSEFRSVESSFWASRACAVLHGLAQGCLCCIENSRAQLPKGLSWWLILAQSSIKPDEFCKALAANTLSCLVGSGAKFSIMCMRLLS